jgi:predicted NBD/HSP70 family sugar kinase
MSPGRVFLGLDSGATTCKVNGVDAEGRPLATVLRQFPTRSREGRETLLTDWMHAAETFLEAQQLTWDAVEGVGVAMPGPFESYGVLGALPNYPSEFRGWNYRADLEERLQRHAGRHLRVATGNDGHLAGLAEAREIQRDAPGGVLLFAPGSGLGSAFVDASGRMLEGDHLSAGFFCCMPLPYAELGLPKLSCGCGRDWGCTERYCALSGLPDLIRLVLPRHPEHPYHDGSRTEREQALELRDRAQQHDPLALEVFDLQAKALGFAVAMGSMAYDPSHVVIGGGLMDPDATTPPFRQRYLDGIRATAAPYLWIPPEALQIHPARLGEHAQAVGAALLAREG